MQALSLRTKLTLALLAIGIASAALVGFVAQQTLLRSFDQILMSESFARFQDDVVQYFTRYGTWDDGVKARPFLDFSRELNVQRGRGRRGRPWRIPGKSRRWGPSY